METSVLLRRRQALLREISSLGPVFRGCVVERSLTCGKEHCSCRKGQLHTAFYLSFRAGGRAYVVELPRRFASEAKRLQRNWLRLKALLEDLALVQVRLWKEVPREGRTSVRRSPRKAP